MSDLVDFFVFLFGCVGITSIIVDGEIFKPVKDYIHNKVPEFFNSLLNCYQCSGFWVGIIFATVINYKYLNNLPNIASGVTSILPEKKAFSCSPPSFITFL